MSYGVKIRDDKTPFELFLAGVCGWELGLQRSLRDGTSNLDRPFISEKLTSSECCFYLGDQTPSCPTG